MSTDSVDVAQLQADTSHSGATFQVASNFNGVEGISEEIYPTSPDFATHCKQKKIINKSKKIK